MAIELNNSGFIHARKLIADGHFVDDLHGEWSEINPGTEEQNRFIDAEGMALYGDWHLGKNPEDNPDRKEAYSFPYGNYQNVYRSGLIAAEERAAQYGYEDIRAAAEELLRVAGNK